MPCTNFLLNITNRVLLHHMSAANNFSRYAIVSLGSNLPFSEQSAVEILALAFNALQQLSDEPLLVSSLYTTSPIDSPEGTPDFYNAVAAVMPDPEESAHSMLAKLQSIENNTGRQRNGIKNEARTLDLDLITFGDEIINTDDLILPHPRAHERCFVLEPMAELVGEAFVIPGQDKTIRQYLDEIPGSQKIRRH